MSAGRRVPAASDLAVDAVRIHDRRAAQILNRDQVHAELLVDAPLGKRTDGRALGCVRTWADEEPRPVTRGRFRPVHNRDGGRRTKRKPAEQIRVPLSAAINAVRRAGASAVELEAGEVRLTVVRAGDPVELAAGPGRGTGTGR